MKRTTFTILLLTMITFMFAQQPVRVTFDGEFGRSTGTTSTIGKKSKATRLSNAVGTTQIKAEVSQNVKNLDPLAPHIIDEAVKMWREQLLFIHDDAEIIINFDTEDYGSSLAYRGITTYIPHTDGIFYPVALSQALNGRGQDMSEEDITIILNSNKNYWYFDGDQQGMQPGQYDFKTAVLRALTQVFGFKASISTTRAEVRRTTFPSPYDMKIINSSNKKYNTLDLTNRTEQSNYIQGGNVYFNSTSSGLKLYAPNPFVRDKSLDYFDSENDLMSYNFKPNSQNWTIDNKVITVMNSIGWPVKETDFKITGSMGNTGICSAYNSYSFTGSAVTGSITNRYWEYRINLKNGQQEIIKTGTTTTFSISPLSQIKNEYERSSDGDILGEIYLRGKVNGITYETTFNLYLEAIPYDIIHDIKIVGIDQWYFQAEVSLYSPGAVEFGMTVTDWEENLTLSTNYDSKTYLKTKTFVLTYDSPIIFQFRAKNSYGTKTKNVTLPAVSYNRSLGNNNLIAGRVKYDIFNFNGNLIKEVYTEEEIYNGSLQNGFYVVREIDQAGNLINSNKIIINK